jgi:hypothetical protein
MDFFVNIHFIFLLLLATLWKQYKKKKTRNEEKQTANRCFAIMASEFFTLHI